MLFVQQSQYITLNDSVPISHVKDMFCSDLLIVSQHIMSRHITSRHIAVRNKTSSSICCQCSEWLLAHALQQEIAVQL